MKKKNVGKVHGIMSANFEADVMPAKCFILQP
jgi:hypothetical protein